MFRTKSLNNQEMKTLIQKNRPSRIQKQNRNYSLRSLISDKTIQYQRHMERLVKQTNQIIYSNKKGSNKKTPKQILQDVSHSNIHENEVEEFNSEIITNSKVSEIKEFQQYINYVQVQTVPTYLNQRTIQQENEPQAYSCMERSHLESQNKSAFKVSLENQQLSDQNRQLRRQIQTLQQRLQTAQLIKIQKQSQSQSLKLKLKILELKILDLEEKNQQRKMQYTKFYIQQVISFENRRKQKINQQCQTFQQSYCEAVQTNTTIFEEIQTQTIETSEQIENLIKKCQHQTENLNKLTCQLVQFQQFITKLRSSTKISGSNSVRRQIINDAQSICERVTTLFNQERELYESALSKQKDKYLQLEQKSTKKMNSLSNLLGLAENQIKALLVRLRQAKVHDVTNYKQMLQTLYKAQSQVNQIQPKQ